MNAKEALHLMIFAGVKIVHPSAPDHEYKFKNGCLYIADYQLVDKLQDQNGYEIRK